MLQKKAKVPAVAVFRSNVCDEPGDTVLSMPSEGEENPCVPLPPLSLICTFSPFFTVMVEGEKENVVTSISMVRVCAGGGVGAGGGGVGAGGGGVGAGGGGGGGGGG